MQIILCGDLNVNNLEDPWEKQHLKDVGVSQSLSIMVEITKTKEKTLKSDWQNLL